jgi:hypothetical protein
LHLSIKSAHAGLLLLFAAFAVPTARAQTTDGLATIQVFPVVVDSGSFKQQFVFRNPNGSLASVQPRYFPGTGTAQASPITCPTFTIPISGSITIASLRTMCPTLVAGSAFGYLYLTETHNENLPFAAFSRVSNPAAAGFSVEAFPAHTFTSATTSISGLRRLVATTQAPAFQTNCFVGSLNNYVAGGIAVPTSVNVELFTAAGAHLGPGTNIELIPGKLTRLLDVFAAANAPPGDHDNATVKFSEEGTDRPALMSFCTVQDNTSFGADFRIAKQEFGAVGWELGGQDGHVRRDWVDVREVVGSSGVGRTFTIQAGASGRNTHVMYFRHPDWVSCELVAVVTEERLLPAYGLEMRMLDDTGAVIVGGNDIIGFQTRYLGDKNDVGDGANTRYTIEVESAVPSAVLRDYGLHCESGNGHTRGDMIRYHDAVDLF